jgi:guanylate kinase
VTRPRVTEARRSRLVVLAGPTAVGKGSVASAVRERHPEVWISVSATTRPPRPGEQEGVHYYFVSDAEFDAMVEAGELLEWAVVHRTARYGTPRRPVEDALAAGRLALLEIDLQGARQVRESMPDALFVFLKPPSWDEMVRRLVGRGTESEAERIRRLETALGELAAEREFDVTVVNHEIHAAADELVALMTLEQSS